MALRNNSIVQLIFSGRDKVSRVVNGISGRLTGLAATARSAGVAITAALAGIGLGRFLKGAIGSAADFEQQLDKVAVVSRATTEELELLKSAAEDAGATTKFTATEAAQALEVLARSGKSASESSKLLKDTLNLAAAEGLELSESAGFVTQTLAQYNLGVTEATRVTDVLVATSQRANTDVRGLGAALNDAGVIASQSGLSLEQTAAAIGILANAGIAGQKAGVALRNIISQLQDPSTNARKELAKLGIESDNLIEVLQGLGDEGENAKDALLAFGLIPAAAIRTLAGEANNLAVLTDAITGVDGAAKAAAEQLADNLIGATTALGSAWDALRKELVGPLIEPLTEQIKEFTARIREAASSESLGFFQERLKNLVLDTITGLDRLATVFRASFASISIVLDAFIIAVNGAKIAAFGLLDAFEGLRINRLKSEFDKLVAQLPRLEAQFGANAGIVTKLKTEISTLRIELLKLTKSQDSYRDSIDRSGKAIDAAIDSSSEAYQVLFGIFNAGTEDAAKGIDTIGDSARELQRVVPPGDLDKRFVEPISSIEGAGNRAASSIDNLSGSVNSLGRSLNNTLSGGAPSKAVEKLASDMKNAAKNTEENKEKTDELSDSIKTNTEQIQKSEKAQEKEQDRRRGGTLSLADAVSNWDAWSDSLKEWVRTIGNVRGIIETPLIKNWIERIAQGREIVDELLVSMDGWIERLNTVSAGELPALIAEIERSDRALQAINEQTLRGLRQAVEKAKQEIADFADTVEDEVFRLTATEEEREKRRFDELLERIRDVGESDRRRARELERRAREHHEKELERIRERIEEREKENEVAGGAVSGGNGITGSGSGIGSASNGGNVVAGNFGLNLPQGQAGSAPSASIVLNAVIADPAQLRAFVRLAKPELDKLNRLSR